MKTKYRVITEYSLEVEADSKTEAEEIAMRDLEKREGLGGNWVWCENLTDVIKES